MSTDPHFSQGPGPLTSEGRYVTFTPAAKFCISFSLLYTISPFWCFVQVKILDAMLILHEFRQVHSSLFFRLLSPLMEMLQTLTSNLQVSMAGILQWGRNHSLWGALQIYCCVTLFCFSATKSTRVPLGWYSLPFLLKAWVARYTVRWCTCEWPPVISTMTVLYINVISVFDSILFHLSMHVCTAVTVECCLQVMIMPMMTTTCLLSCQKLIKVQSL